MRRLVEAVVSHPPFYLLVEGRQALQRLAVVCRVLVATIAAAPVLVCTPLDAASITGTADRARTARWRSSSTARFVSSSSRSCAARSEEAEA